MTRRAAVPQAEIKRAVKTAEAAGHEIAGIELRQDGSVFVRFGKPLAAAESTAHHDLDSVIQEVRRQNGKARHAN